MIHYSRTIFDLSQLSNCNHHLHLTCQSCQGTCHTTEVRKSRLIHPPLLLTMKNTKDCWVTQSFILILKYLPIYPTTQFNLETLATLSLPIPAIAFDITMSSQHMHFLYHNSTGQSILSTLAIFALLISTHNLPFNVTLACDPLCIWTSAYGVIYFIQMYYF
jgi:hypothetical protein